MRQIKKITVESKDNELEFKIPKHSIIIHIGYLSMIVCIGKYYNYSFEVMYEENSNPRCLESSEYDIIKYHIKFNNQEIPSNLFYYKSFIKENFYNNYMHLYMEAK